MTNLLLEGLTKKFGNFAAVDDLKLEIKTGTFSSLLGPSGCGKTTTLRMIAGLETPTAGKIMIDDRDVTDLPARERKVGLVFQSYALFPDMTVFDNLAFGLRVTNLPETDITREVKQFAETFQLDNVLESKPAKLGLDYRQRIALARTMITKPSVLLLDEPLSNLDAALRSMVRVELKRIHQQLNQTILFVTHDQLEAMTMSDMIAVMDRGKLLQHASPREIYNKPNTLFVANFIGSPTMNFLPCTLVHKEKGTFLDGGSFLLDVGDFMNLLPTSSEFVLGIRPEDLRIMRSGRPDIEAIVELIEPLGPKKILNLRLEDSLVKTFVSRDYSCEMGQKLGLGFNRDRIHIFEKSSGATIV